MGKRNILMATAAVCTMELAIQDASPFDSFGSAGSIDVTSIVTPDQSLLHDATPEGSFEQQVPQPAASSAPAPGMAWAAAWGSFCLIPNQGQTAPAMFVPYNASQAKPPIAPQLLNKAGAERANDFGHDAPKGKPAASTCSRQQVAMVIAPRVHVASQPGPTIEEQPRWSMEGKLHSASLSGSCLDKAEENRTTIMLRNIPNKFTQARVLHDFDSRGYKGTYDFFYLPIDFKKRQNMGYCFVNFRDTKHAQNFMITFRKLKLDSASPKLTEPSFARVQGRDPNVEMYRNSPIAGVPVKGYRPMVFGPDGEEEDFPEPDVPLHLLPPIQLRADRV